MRTRRLLGASLTSVLAAGLVGGAMPSSVAAGDNDESRWDHKRVVRLPDAADGPVQVLGGGSNQWSLVARNIGGDTWRLRESEAPLDFGDPSNDLRKTVTDFVADATVDGYVYGAYVADEKVQAFRRSAHRPYAYVGAVAADQGGPTTVTAGNTADALVTHGDTWMQLIPRAPGWVTYPDPNVDGVPGNAGQSFGFTSDMLLAFWNDPNGDLRVAQRPRTEKTAAFSAPQTIAANEKVVRFVATADKHTLVTQAADGAINVYDYASDATPFGFVKKEQVAPAGLTVPTPAPGSAQVLLDRHQTVTIAWKEARQGGGLMFRQLDRPGSTYFEFPTLVPGTRRGDARIVTGAQGNLTVAVRRDSAPAIVRVKHLPIGRGQWTDGIRLISPKPITDASAGWGLGMPASNNDLRLAVNDKAGVYGFKFDAPSGITKVTKPVTKTHPTKTYLLSWNTTWTLADNWQVRTRLDKPGNAYGAWRTVPAGYGETATDVTRPRGKTFCYQAKGFLGEREVTSWSEQKCVTVRR